ncbi:MAG: hypothetical protein AB1411_15920 [Nitrospirota bacterium]
MKAIGSIFLMTACIVGSGCAYLDCERQWRESYAPPASIQDNQATKTDVERGRALMKQDFIRACLGE